MSSRVTRERRAAKGDGSQSIDFKLNTEKGNLKCLSSSAWPAPAPRSGRSITSSSPTRASPRDGRFIERLGYFNPLLPKEKTERLKFDIEKAQEWMKKGAQPSDRVKRFLDAAGVLKREARNNPEKAVPRKERKAQAEEAPRPRNRRCRRQGRRAAKAAAQAAAS